MAIVVIHGPQRSGKTFNAEAFRQFYGCARTLDWWTFRRACTSSQEGDLLLTTEAPDVVLRHLPYATIVPIDDARSALGLEPAPLNGFSVHSELRPTDPDPVTAHSFADLGIVLPLTAGEDGEIVDATGACFCVVDHNAELPDDRVARIQVIIARAVNAYDGGLPV